MLSILHLKKNYSVCDNHFNLVNSDEKYVEKYKNFFINDVGKLSVYKYWRYNLCSWNKTIELGQMEKLESIGGPAFKNGRDQAPIGRDIDICVKKIIGNFIIATDNHIFHYTCDRTNTTDKNKYLDTYKLNLLIKFNIEHDIQYIKYDKNKKYLYILLDNGDLFFSVIQNEDKIVTEFTFLKNNVATFFVNKYCSNILLVKKNGNMISYINIDGLFTKTNIYPNIGTSFVRLNSKIIISNNERIMYKISFDTKTPEIHNNAEFLYYQDVTKNIKIDTKSIVGISDNIIDIKITYHLGSSIFYLTDKNQVWMERKSKTVRSGPVLLMDNIKKLTITVVASHDYCINYGVCGIDFDDQLIILDVEKNLLNQSIYADHSTIDKFGMKYVIAAKDIII